MRERCQLFTRVKGSTFPKVPYLSNNLHWSILVSRLYVLLNLDLCLVDPVTDVINLARSHDKIESLVKVTFGETDDMDRALDAVTQGMITGCWVILENCHLAAKWTEEFLHQLEVKVGSKLRSKCVPYFFLGSLLETCWSAIGQFFPCL